MAPSDSYVDSSSFEAEYDHSYDGVMRSVDVRRSVGQSTQRMLTDKFDILFIHDCGRYTHGDRQPEIFAQALRSAYPALEMLHDQGVVTAIGFGVNEADACSAALKNTDADCLLLVGRYTLLEQEPLDDLLLACAERGVGLVLGSVYNSGIPAIGPIDCAKFNYTRAPEAVKSRTGAIEQTCSQHGCRWQRPRCSSPTPPAVASVCLGHPP
nr:aldo/keto reductase [Nocardia donostiensis]